MKRTHLVFVLIASVLVVDQCLKIWIKTHMVLGQEFYVFDWFRIHFLENEGMAFGLTLGGKAGKLILSLVRIVATAAIAWYIRQLILKKESRWMIASFALIFAGALGNILDSCFYGLLFNESFFQVAQFMPEGGGYASFLHGRVVDMFYFPLFAGSYPSWFPWVGGDDFLFFRPVFNIADTSISVGVALFFLQQLLEKKSKIASA